LSIFESLDSNGLLHQGVQMSAELLAAFDPDRIDDEAQLQLRSIPHAEITPTIPRMHRPEISYYLPNVGSGTYNIYCVMVPELEVDENGIYVVSTAETNLPYLIQFDMSYCAANGTLQTASFGQKSNDVTKVDTVFVGQHTFPVSYYGLSDYHPILKLTTNYRFNTKISGGEYDGELYWNHYSRNYRIASVILRPIEQDAYLGKEY